MNVIKNLLDGALERKGLIVLVALGFAPFYILSRIAAVLS